MEKSSAEGLRIHAAIRPPEAEAAPKEAGEEPPAGRERRARARRRRTRAPLSAGDRLLRNTAIACAVLLAVLTAQNIDQPWSRLALNGVESALTMRINLDESLGRLSFVRDLVPESALVFLNLSAQETFAPVEGEVAHAYTEAQPWIAYACAPGEKVRALEPGTVSAVTPLSGGGWGVLLDHGAGLESVYAYLGEVAVAAGESVSAGAVLGAAPEAGDASLYFEMRQDGEAIDPAERYGL